VREDTVIYMSPGDGWTDYASVPLTVSPVLGPVCKNNQLGIGMLKLYNLGIEYVIS
jgi:hypothetical protein